MTDGTILNPKQELIKVISKWVSDNVETKAPAVITDVSKYGSDRVLTVQPLVGEIEGDGDVILPNKVYNCPVILSACNDGYLSFPFTVGEIVAIGYCKRSIEEVTYGSGNSQVIPDDSRVFTASDAVVLGYWNQPSQGLPVSTTDFEIKFKNTLFSISPSDVITLDNSTSSITVDGSDIVITNGTSTITISGSTITLDNGSGTIELQGSGTVDMNGVTIDSSGNVTIPTSLILGGKEINNHIHGGVTTGGASTLPNT